jgi:hypothetical protein
MARVNVPLVGELAIIQGETYQALSLEFPSDKTDWTPRGQIRTKLLGDAGTLLAEFSFATPAYDDESDVTIIYPRLSPAQTAAILKTKWQGTGEYSKTAVYYYDVELESDAGEVVKSVPAIVQVIGEVTGTGVPPSTGETFLVASNNLSEVDPTQARSNLGITSGAKPDWDADESAAEGILNKPDLTVYATTEAVALALEEKEDIDSTILRADDIGDTIQAFDVDYNSVKSKANSAIQSDTLALALADLSEVNADPFIFNGVAYFNRATKPTQRDVGVPLVIGDRWYKVNDGTDWFWNGTYWLSCQLYYISGSLFSTITTGTAVLGNGYFPTSGDTPYPLFLTEVRYNYRVLNGSVDAGNYYRFTLSLVNNYSGTSVTVPGGTILANASGENFSGKVQLNTPANNPVFPSVFPFYTFQYLIEKIETPSGGISRPQFTLGFRLFL